ncbi:SPOR domain-containing protein [Saccharicrinis aurantiacus]|uniref:SPOR domain-containing protein n=1 Tax=Saccharicrinis aurantiacus TaxID=1849719 RepID=UPI002493A4FF|nr:SPOR domain-containing protein [Saccharicrinis aurantiacus]
MNKWIIGILAVGTLSFTSCKSLQKTGSSSFDDSESPYLEEEPIVKESEPKSDAKPIIVKEEKVKVIEEKNTESFKYYVIIGSFKVLENARNYKTDLTQQGFTPVILENTEGLYRVSVSAYNEETSARNKIANIRHQYEKYSDTWLLKAKQ